MELFNEYGEPIGKFETMREELFALARKHAAELTQDGATQIDLIAAKAAYVESVTCAFGEQTLRNAMQMRRIRRDMEKFGLAVALVTQLDRVANF